MLMLLAAVALGLVWRCLWHRGRRRLVLGWVDFSHVVGVWHGQFPALGAAPVVVAAPRVRRRVRVVGPG